MIMEVKTSDFKNKCGDCKYFNTKNRIDGTCNNDKNKVKSKQRYYNSKSCVYKETRKKILYLFLDVDGVLNNEKYIVKCYEKHHKPMHMNHVPFNPTCLSNLMVLIQSLGTLNYDVKIILSSTWRLDNISYEIVNARLAEYGLKITDCTPYIDGNRGIEIKKFLSDKLYDELLILDDDDFDIKPYYPNNLVKTNFKNGLTKDKVTKALNIIIK